jgi:hypothetical protein
VDGFPVEYDGLIVPGELALAVGRVIPVASLISYQLRHRRSERAFTSDSIRGNIVAGFANCFINWCDLQYDAAHLWTVESIRHCIGIELQRVRHDGNATRDKPVSCIRQRSGDSNETTANVALVMRTIDADADATEFGLERRKGSARLELCWSID